jgi:hypothetical protein
MRIRIRRPGRRRRNDLRPTSPRQKLLIAALAVGTALVVLWAVLRPELQAIEARQKRAAAAAATATARPDRPRCADGQTQGCVGGRLDVQVIAPAGSGAAAGAD